MPRAARIGQVVQENYRTRTYTLDCELEARPGQYIMLWLPRLDEKPISLVSATPVTVTVADVGPFTHALSQLGPGDRVHFRGPYGNSFETTGQRLLLVGGGYGVGPMHFLAREALPRGVTCEVVIGARNGEDVLFVEQFRKLGIEPVVTTDDGSRGMRGLATDGARRILDEWGAEALYACGPEKMMRALGELAEARGLSCSLSVERYMKCGGLSLCGACEVNGVLVCAEGPVLDWRLLKTLPDFGRLHRGRTAAHQPW
ncbi:MAG: dihydroorotate dehydrogenase electron transfer subunit [Chloroflexi bacterium]|nr:dihydroorotate dehydrogenase electron transfer subunit [Chloroflexota bacterium]